MLKPWSHELSIQEPCFMFRNGTTRSRDNSETCGRVIPIFFEKTLRCVETGIETPINFDLSFPESGRWQYYYWSKVLWRRLNSRFKKRSRGHLFMALNGASDVLAADWLPQTHVKNYHNFSCVVIRFSSEVEIPLTLFRLYNKYI